jgi:hypothetical protein
VTKFVIFEGAGMFGKKKVLVRLGELETLVQRVLDYVEGESRAVVALERRLERLEKQNGELFDRLMARDWESFASFRPEESTRHEARFTYDPAADDVNAGEILEIKDEAE